MITLSDVFKITVDDLIKDKNIECTANDEDENDKEDEEDDDVGLIAGGFIIGMAIGFITENFMWATAGSFLGLELGYIINEIRRKN